MTHNEQKFWSTQETEHLVNTPLAKEELPIVFETSVKPAVAVLTKSVGLNWHSGSNKKRNDGSALEAGLFSFADGMVQLEFMQGATAILEGPVETRLHDANSLSIKHGKLRAHVPKVAVGFTVDLPMGKVIDLGTDFGVEVHEEGSAEVYVYRGKVRYQGFDFDGNEVDQYLSGGEAIYLDSYGLLTPLDMPAGNFMGSADLASRSLENANRRRSAWIQNSKKSPPILVHYCIMVLMVMTLGRVCSKTRQREITVAEMVL